MARHLSNMFLKGMAGLLAPRSNRVACGSFYQSWMKYSANLPNDPDTHDDFRPINKAESSDLSLADMVEQVDCSVPDFPQCGFSSLAVRVETIHHWPTFPQIFIKGEFVGGSDIILNMHQTGELKEKLHDVAVSQESK